MTIINLTENIINNLSELISDVEEKLIEISEIKFNLQDNGKKNLKENFKNHH